MDAELAGEPDQLAFQSVRIYTGPGIARRLAHEIHGLHRHEAAELVRRINAPNVAALVAEALCGQLVITAQLSGGTADITCDREPWHDGAHSANFTWGE